MRCKLVAVAAVLMLVTGCGSTSSQTFEIEGSSEDASEEVSSEAEAQAPETIGGPLGEVGTITAHGEGTSFSEDYKLGPLLYSSEGTPSEQVLEACGANYTTTIAQTVFSRGEMTVSYDEGVIPEILAFVPNETVYGYAYLGTTAMEVNGVWQCLEPFSLTFEPGESRTFPIWVLSQVLSNSEPEVSEAALHSWRFVGPQINAPNVGLTIHGPNAASCDSDVGSAPALMLYATRSTASC